jgi:Tol biopolymer transport system component
MLRLVARRSIWPVLLAAFALLLCVPGAAEAGFPGGNGKIVFLRSEGPAFNAEIYTMNADGTEQTNVTNNPDADEFPAWSPDGTKISFNRCSPIGVDCDVYTMNADGSGVTRLTNNPADDFLPAWSPDGTKIAFGSSRDDPSSTEIYTMNADGTGQTNITNSPGFDDFPAWSPDGTKIAFHSFRDDPDNAEIYTMNADGSGQTNITNNAAHDVSPNWSPDGTRIAFGSSRDDPRFDIYTMNADGSGVTRVTNNAVDHAEPAWSPDGTKIAFESSSEIYTMNADGSAVTRLTNNDAGDGEPDWQPAFSGYPRPKGATPLRASLVVAYQPCTSPNREHGAPLVTGSCDPPVQASGHLTVGTRDANGQADQAVGSVTLDAILGNPATPADEADMRIATSLTDVRRKAGLADYDRELQTVLHVRLTDRLASGGNIPQTTQDFPFSVTVPCTVTPDPSIGASCSLTTSADTVVPGAVAESKRSIWALDKVDVYDGGTDGRASTTADNTLFETQGVFVP